MLKTARSYFHSSGWNTGMWRKDGQTDRIALAITAALRAMWTCCKNENVCDLAITFVALVTIVLADSIAYINNCIACDLGYLVRSHKHIIPSGGWGSADQAHLVISDFSKPRFWINLQQMRTFTRCRRTSLALGLLPEHVISVSLHSGDCKGVTRSLDVTGKFWAGAARPQSRTTRQLVVENVNVFMVDDNVFKRQRNDGDSRVSCTL